MQQVDDDLQKWCTQVQNLSKKRPKIQILSVVLKNSILDLQKPQHFLKNLKKMKNVTEENLFSIIDQTCGSVFNSDWAPIFSNFVKSLFLQTGGQSLNYNVFSSYEFCKNSFMDFAQLIFQSPSFANTNFILPLLRFWIWFLRKFAEIANQEDSASETSSSSYEEDDSGTQSKYLEDAARSIQRVFQFAYGERTDCNSKQELTQKSKKMILLYALNESMRIYFKINRLKQCEGLIRTFKHNCFPKEPQDANSENVVKVDNFQFPVLDDFPIPDRVTFSFFYGRLALLKQDFAEAHSFLSKSFKLCKSKQQLSMDFLKNPNIDPFFRNKSKIFGFLFISCMALGVKGTALPKPALFEKFSFPPFYVELMNSYKQGNLRRFCEIVAQNADHFSKKGILFILQTRCKLIVFRNLLRKMFMISRKSAGTNQPSILDLNLAKKMVFDWMKLDEILISTFKAGSESPSDEKRMIILETLISSLISNNLLSGYIHHQKQVVVLSKTNPFP